MSRPRFLADHDLNEYIVTGVLRREPMLVWVRTRDVGMSDCSDAEVLAYANDHGYIVVSYDVKIGLAWEIVLTEFFWPHDITLQALRLECFFPADDATEQNIMALPHLTP